MSYTLYYSPGTASMATHLALLEPGVPYRLSLLDFERKEQRAPAYPLSRIGRNRPCQWQ